MIMPSKANKPPLHPHKKAGTKKLFIQAIAPPRKPNDSSDTSIVNNTNYCRRRKIVSRKSAPAGCITNNHHNEQQEANNNIQSAIATDKLLNRIFKNKTSLPSTANVKTSSSSSSKPVESLATDVGIISPVNSDKELLNQVPYSKLKAENSNLVSKVESLQREVDTLRAAHSDIQVKLMRQMDIASTTATTTHKASSHHNIIEYRKTIQLLEEKVRVLESHLLQLQAKSSEDLSHTNTIMYQSSSTQTTLNYSKAVEEKLQNELQDLSSRLASSTAARFELEEAYEKQIQDAQSSFIKLCIVAPNVNVHLSNNNSSSTVTLKPTMPELSRLIQRDILPKFSTVFVQSTQHSTAWQNDVLQDIQSSITSSIKHLYNNIT